MGLKLSDAHNVKNEDTKRKVSVTHAIVRGGLTQVLTVLVSHLSLYGLISSCQLKMDTSFTTGWSTATGAAPESYDKPNDTKA